MNGFDPIQKTSANEREREFKHGAYLHHLHFGPKSTNHYEISSSGKRVLENESVIQLKRSNPEPVPSIIHHTCVSVTPLTVAPPTSVP